MKIVNSLFAFVLLCFTGNSLFSQSVASADDHRFPTVNLTEIKDDSWSFYTDEENKLYFIDFEKINFNLSEIIVKNESGDVLFRDDVLNLPVDTIYEINLSEYDAGNYEVQLRSFTGMIRKQVNIK